MAAFWMWLTEPSISPLAWFLGTLAGFFAMEMALRALASALAARERGG